MQFGRRQGGTTPVAPPPPPPPPPQAQTWEPSAGKPLPRKDDQPRPTAAEPAPDDGVVAALVERLLPIIGKELPAGEALRISRGNLASRIAVAIDELCRQDGRGLADQHRRR